MAIKSPSTVPLLSHDLAGQRQRRELWLATLRARSAELFHPDGSPKLPLFGPPHREAVWYAPALYTGSDADIALANRIVARWHDASEVPKGPGSRETHGSHFGIFQSNSIIHLYHRFRDRLTPEAEAVMRVHAGHGLRTYQGCGQPDTKFHGANDNMPMMATFGMIFAGELLGDDAAVRQGLWYLHHLRLLLSRAAWVSEYNSSTYSPITLTGAAALAAYARDPEVRELALEIEHRLWAEILLHYHPGTFRQAGPQSRAYAMDYAGHTHGLQFVLWLAFGEAVGRNPLQSHFQPDGVEVVAVVNGRFPQVAPWAEFADMELHVPPSLAALVKGRSYPARLRGRAEALASYDVPASVVHTETYMEEAFSLGTASGPWFDGSQTATLYGTYRLKPDPRDHKDGASFFCKYRLDGEAHGQPAPEAHDVRDEKFLHNQGWTRALQKDNTALLLAVPALNRAPVESETLRLDLVFPAHYGKIVRTVIGGGPVRDGAAGESAEPVPVSIEAGEVYIHVLPLLPTNLPRRAALRWSVQNRYEVLELVNYEGPKRAFSAEELRRCLNGFVVTIDAKERHASLEEFHRRRSDFLLTDYLLGEHRFVHFQRDDVRFDLVHAPLHGGAQTEAVDGRQVPRPVIESNQLNVDALPFVSGPVPPAFPAFPWGDSLEVCWYPGAAWIIGSRGLPGEPAYSRRAEYRKPAGESPKP